MIRPEPPNSCSLSAILRPLPQLAASLPSFGWGSILVQESVCPAHSSVSSLPLLDWPLTKPHCPNPDSAPNGDTGWQEGREAGPRLSASPPWQVASPRGRRDSLGPRVRRAGWPAPQVPPSPWHLAPLGVWPVNRDVLQDDGSSRLSRAGHQSVAGQD